jgi:uncharacterized membrane protein
VGFVFAGGVVGIGLDRFARTDSSSTPLVRWGGLLAGGAAAVWAGRYAASLPSLLPGSSFWTTSPSFFVIRLGLLVSVLAAAGLTEYFWRGGSRWLAPLARLGRHSLFLYWVHIELVYGYLAWPIRKALPLRQVAVAYVLFTVAMYGTLGIRDRLAKWWRSWRQFPGTTARAASA